MFLGNGSCSREKIRCDTGTLPNTERVPRPHRVFARRVPYKSFIIIDLLEKQVPEGAQPLPLPARYPFPRLLPGSKGVGETMPIQWFAGLCGQYQSDAGLARSGYARRDRRSNGSATPGTPESSTDLVASVVNG